MSFRHSFRIRRGKVCESSFPGTLLYESLRNDCRHTWECPRNQPGRDKDSERNLSRICGEVAE